MTTRAMWTAGVGLTLALALTGCGGGKVTNDGGAGGGGATAGCVYDTDCPDPQLFFCNPTTSACEPSCRTKSDCTNRGQYALSYCSGALGCQCDEGKCVGSLCSADADCGAGQVCRSGACVATPAASSVASCHLSPDFVVLKAGTAAKFSVSAWDANQAPVVVAAGDVSWSAPAGSPFGAPSPSTGLTAAFTAGATPTSGTDAVAAVKATIGGASCQAKAIVLPAAPAANQVFAVVTDELSGRPLAGLDVVLSKPDGTAILQGGQGSVKTDARGLATLTLDGTTTTYSVSAFGPDHGYVTIANYSGSSRYLALVTRRNQSDKYGGFTGTFKNLPVTANVHVGLAGMSLAGSITSLSINQLLGASVPTDIKFGTIDASKVPVPSGVFLGFGTSPIKSAVAGQGLAGVCFTNTGEPDEAAIAAGTCGVRSAWGLSGDVPADKIPTSLVSGATSNLDFGALLTDLLPLFKTFSSSVSRDVKFSLKSTPTGADGGLSFSDTSSFTPQDLDFAQVPLAFSFAAKMPTLPKLRGAYADAAAVIGGVWLSGRGVVPLGLGVGLSKSGNGIIDLDKQSGYSTAGLIQLRMAPSHHGLEGGQYGLLAAALSTKALSDPSIGLGASTIFGRLPGNKLSFDVSGTSPVDLSSLAFLGFPEGAKFNYGPTAVGTLPSRGLSMPVLAGVDVVKVTFVDQLDRHWDVYVDPAATATGFVLPTPPGALADRLYAQGLVASGRSGLTVQALRLNATPETAGGAEVTFAAFVEKGATNADRTTELLTAFSFLDYGAPSVAFTTPDADGKTITKGSKVSLKVSRFKLGASGDADGAVKLSFALAGAPIAGCSDQVFTAETTSGTGTVDYTLPAACVGANVVMRADLLRPDNAPIAPAVYGTRTVTIQ